MPESKDRGALTEAVFYILLTLFEPLHGYGIMQKVESLSKGRVKLGSGTLYGAINTLLEKGYICPASDPEGSRKKSYQITETGKTIVKDEITRLEELLENSKRIVGGAI